MADQPELAGNHDALRLVWGAMRGRPIPAELNNLTQLWMVNLSGNNLRGELPANLQNLPGSGYDFINRAVTARSDKK